jgi:hypothetical protein
MANPKHPTIAATNKGGEAAGPTKLAKQGGQSSNTNPVQGKGLGGLNGIGGGARQLAGGVAKEATGKGV